MSNTHPILDKSISVNYVKKQFQTPSGSVAVMAYANGYFMLRYKGCMPFCKHFNDVNKLLLSGDWIAPKINPESATGSLAE